MSRFASVRKKECSWRLEEKFMFSGEESEDMFLGVSYASCVNVHDCCLRPPFCYHEHTMPACLQRVRSR
jgi:hypothetical protein